MRLKKILILSAALSLLVILTITGILVMFTEKQIKVLDTAELYDDFSDATQELNLLATEYLLYHSERSREQWFSRHASLERTLNALRPEMSDADYASLNQEHGKARRLFLQTIEAYEGHEASSTTSELERSLASQLQVTMQSMSSHASRLSLTLRNLNYQLGEQLQWLVGGLTLIILALVSALLIMTGTRMLLPLQRLGTEIQTLANDLSFRIQPKKNDEIGDLASSFNALAERLQSSLVSVDELKSEIETRKHSEEALQRSEDSLKEAQRLARIGNWELDLRTNALSWSDEVFRIFEIDAGQFGASYDAFLDTIHPEDRDAVNQAYTDSVKNRQHYQITHRLRFPDQRIRYVIEMGETFYDESGEPLRSIGTVQDVTEQEEYEQRLQRASAEWTIAMDQFDDAIYLLDLNSP